MQRESNYRILSKFILFISICLLATVIAFYVLNVTRIWRQSRTSDFAFFYASVRSYFEGEDIYTPRSLESFSYNPSLSKERNSWSVLPNLNPPFQTLFLLPLGKLKYNFAFSIWSILSISCGIIAANLINRTYFPVEKRNRWIFLLLLLFVYFPTWITIDLGQFSLFLLLLVTLGWMASRAEKDALAGLIFGLMLSLKIFTGLFLVFFFFKRRWKLISWYIGSFLVMSAIAFLFFGPDSYQNYLIALRTVNWHATSWNASFYGFFTRLFGSTENIALINSPQYALPLIFGTSLLLVLYLLKNIFLDKTVNNEIKYDLDFSLVLVSMLLLSPLGWMYYFVLLIIPFVICWKILSIKSHPIGKVFLITAWILSTIPSPMILPSEFKGDIEILLGAGGFYFYSLLLFVTVLSWTRHQIIQNTKKEEENLLARIIHVDIRIPRFR